MQLDKVLISIGALVCTSLLGIGLTTKEVEAQTARPYVVFVNGYQNCCSWGMTSLQNRLVDQMNAEPRYVPYSNFNNDGSSGNTSTDEQFLRDGEDFINNQLERNRPLILIGHSFGGDSVLKLLPRINRKIQLVAVIDPVSTGGFRATLSRYTVPSNVDYFFNRWQENVPFPNDFGLNGSISCNARTCDQDSENIARNADFSPITTECRWDEVTCPGFVAPIPFVRNGRKGTKQVRVSHQDLPRSAHIQQVLGDKIQAQLAEFRPPSSMNQDNAKSPIFDADFYLMSYGDLRNAFGTDQGAAQNHWLTYGIKEGRRSSPAFDVQYYLSQYADLQNAFGSSNYSAAITHWLTYGIKEGRKSSIVFDVRYYLGKYPDLQNAFGSDNYSAAVNHWLTYGVKEGRQGSSDFDPRFYLSNNPDVAKVYGANNYKGAIEHYLEYGRKEGRRGSP